MNYKDINQSYNNALSLIFRKSILLELIEKGKSEYLNYAINKSNFVNIINDFQYNKVFDCIYSYLETYYRNEYVYKNKIAKKLLLERHSLTNSTLINELELHQSIADVVIINGTSTVYEIKTELDTFNRLPQQIETYKSVFDNIYVVTHESQVNKLKKIIDSTIGIITLNNKFKLNEIKKSKSNINNIIPEKLFKIFRKNEYLNVIKKEFNYIPDVPDYLLRSECRKMFSKLPREKAHQLFIELINKRNNDKSFISFINNLPNSLKYLGLTSNLNSKKRLILNSILDTSYCLQ